MYEFLSPVFLNLMWNEWNVLFDPGINSNRLKITKPLHAIFLNRLTQRIYVVHISVKEGTATPSSSKHLTLPTSPRSVCSHGGIIIWSSKGGWFMLRRVAGVCILCTLHRGKERTVRIGSLQGLYERFSIRSGRHLLAPATQAGMYRGPL